MPIRSPWVAACYVVWGGMIVSVALLIVDVWW